MAYGDNPHDQQLKRAWEEFCDKLKSAQSLIFDDTLGATALDRATGFQYLSRYISKALNEKFEFNDPLYPQLWQLQTPTNKSFGDNPDCTYLVTWLDGAHTYRIVGNRGTVCWVSFLVNGKDFTTTYSAISNSQLKTEWDGSFHITLSAEQHPGNWLKLGPGPNFLFIRQFFGEWDTEEPMWIRVERAGASEPPPPLTPERLIRGLQEAGDWFLSDSRRWVEWVEHYSGTPNQWVSGMPAWAGDGQTQSLGRQLQFCYWKIQPDEALIFEVKPPRCAYWNFELANRWFNSTDYRYRLSSLNCKQAVYEDDGSVRIAVSHVDPQIPNWLDVGGHCVGMVNQRWVEAQEHPVPSARLIKIAELPKLLPPNARRITPEERGEQLRRRKIGVDRRFPV